MTTLLERARGLRELIQDQAVAIEDGCTMTGPVVDALAEADLFRLIVPRKFGGHEADVATIVEVCAELSYADGSVGWAFAQNTTVMAYAAYLAPEFAEPLAAARAAAGMFAPLGSLEETEDGYRVSGSYQFGSGSGHAEFMGGAGLVMRDGEIAPSEGALPQIRGFIVPTERVVMQGNWDVMGLRGTGSFDFEVPEQVVDVGETFAIFEHETITGGPVYGLGPLALGTISSSAWALGVAKRALDEVAAIARAGRMRLGSLPLAQQPGFQRDQGAHRAALRAASLYLRNAYQTAVDAVVDAADAGTRSPLLRETRAASSHAVDVAKRAVTAAYEAAGSHGMRNPSRLQRCFRDIYVGAQHQVFDERNFIEFAKPELGQEPAPF